MEYVPHPQPGHQAGTSGPLPAAQERIPFPPAPQGPAGNAGYRVAKIQNRYTRPRLLLAPTCQVQVQLHPEIKGGFLEKQIFRQRGP